MSTTDLYQDFILLDTSDAVAVDEFLKDSKVGMAQNGANKGASTRKSFLSPTRRSGGSAHKSSVAKNQHANSNCSPKLNCSFDDNNVRPSSPASAGLDNCDFGYNMDDGCHTFRDSDNSDADDDDDPWKPLNPHEPGNLKVKPFRKGSPFSPLSLYQFALPLLYKIPICYHLYDASAVKALKKNGFSVTRRVSMSILFPPAKLHGPVSPELMEMWEMRRHAHERQKDSQSPPLYEKVLSHGWSAYL